MCVDQNVFKMSKIDRTKAGVEDLPGDLEQAMIEFKNSEFMRKTFGEHIFDRYLEAKSEEWFSYITQVHKWETDEYLSSY